jgi:ubiquinone/menaquinone biosynthesis C-methylase UbiE
VSGGQQWQVVGSAAQVYQRELVPAIFGPWAPRVVAFASPAAGERVIDVACGTGVVARLAAERVGPDGRVVGLDLNPGMLAVARGLPVAGAPVGWVQASAGRLPFQDGSFDLACCQLGLQFFPDRPAALADMARVLVPGGRLVAMVWRSIDRSPGFEALAEALDRHVGPAAGAMMRAPFGLGDDGTLRGLVEGAGFRDVTVERRAGVVRFPSARALLAAQEGGSPLAGPIGDAGPAARAGLVEDLEAALAAWQGADGLAFPIEALLAGGRTVSPGG